MRRILLSCAILGLVSLPATTASARASGAGKAGFLVVRKAAGAGGVTGSPVVTLVVHDGFVLGSIKPQDQARVDVYQLPSKGNQGGPTAVGDVSTQTMRWHHRFTRHEFRGTGFRFRAMGGFYRVVVRGSGVYLFAGGTGTVLLHGSSFDPGTYSVDGAPFRSLPKRIVTHRLGRA